MNSNKTVLRSHSDEDLLCVPGVCLGFRPEESCVVVGVCSSEVAFCARCDLGWLEEEGARVLAQQILAASRELEQVQFVVLGYTETPAAAELVLTQVAVSLGLAVVDVLVATASRYWRVTPTGLEPPEGMPWQEQDTNLLATAVYHGIQVAADREAVVVEVRPGVDQAEAEYLVSSAATYLKDLVAAERADLLEFLLAGDSDLLPLEAAQVSVLVAEPEFAGWVVSSLGPKTANRFRRHLAAARRVCTPDLAPGVLVLLALACWLSCQAAQHTDCLAQLEALAPGHRLLPMLRALHYSAVRPPDLG
ncbi:MAG: DUF4192 family protein [Propionibacteriaceae bacterium]|nr:DUF4192 family protein [Propionibacteriaceae bacterium]